MKKFFSVLLCTTMLMCSATGCGTDNKPSVDSKVEQSPSIEYETIEPPESGWTVESIASTIRLCGKPIELPFTVGSLGEGFEFVDDTGCVLYNGHPAFVAAFVNSNKSGDRYSTTVRRLGTFERYLDEDFRNYFVINGVGIGSSKEDVIAAFGEPDFQSDSNFEYNADHDDNENSVSNIVRFGFGDLDKVQGIFITLNNG
ncbi:MAG: hypothetical protein K2K91_10300 [Ruminococcus sp.]|nr:hypothetical protein [Ruminococcus sp.]MDE7097839.1 hypothetical protein [Ruminococcus sp.]